MILIILFAALSIAQIAGWAITFCALAKKCEHQDEFNRAVIRAWMEYNR